MFIEMFNVTAALFIIVFCGHVLIRTYKLDKSLLKARLFLNDMVMQQIWTSISIAGAAFALNALITLTSRYLDMPLHEYYFVELTQVIFVIAFIHAVYNWNQFIGAQHQSYILKH